MKLAVLVTFKNEADVLPFWLKYMESQVDYFLFRDNQSTDNGAEIVKKHPKTVFYEKVSGSYECRMYDKLIVEARKLLNSNDWFMIWAPDLFPFFKIKENIGKANLNGCNCIKTFFPNFFFTLEMYKRYSSDQEYKKRIDNFNISNYSYFLNTGKNPSMIIRNVTDHNNNRVRYLTPKQEPPEIPNKKMYGNSLCVGHYRFRSPKQIMDRFEIRKKINPNRNSNLSFYHYPTWNWEDYLVPEKKLKKLEGSIKPKQLSRVKLENIIRSIK